MDYNHPLLGAGFGPGYKIFGGYDFVGDAFNGEDTPCNEPNPSYNCYFNVFVAPGNDPLDEYVL